LILAGLGWYVWSARSTLQTVKGFDRNYLFPMLLVPLASLAVNGRIGRDLVAEFGVQLDPLEWYGLAAVQSLGNYLPVPQAGAMARGVYLKRVHALPYSTYAATVVVTYVTSLALSGWTGLAGLAVLGSLGRPSPWLLWLVFAGLSMAVLMFTPAAKLLPVPRRLAMFDTGLARLRRHSVLTRVVVHQIVLIALTTTGLWLACHAFSQGHAVTWLMALMLGLMVMASGVINVTPGNVGVEQGAAELTARLLHVPPMLGFLASALFRLMAVLVVFVIGPIFSAYLARRKGLDA
jgi:uncharacterized membrane protein YbhN (UPF0104 family)